MRLEEATANAAEADDGKTVVAVFAPGKGLDFLGPLLEAADATLRVVRWPDPRCLHAEIAVGWQAPADLVASMPRLRLLHSVAAGVDNIIDGQDLRDVDVCRVTDPQLAQGMFEYVLWGVLQFHRHFDLALRNQSLRQWLRPPLRPAAECRVGLMGLGELGGTVAGWLSRLGYGVRGWSRTPKALPGIATWHGEEGLADFLEETEILVCMLPLTPRTHGILDRALFERLPRGAALIHCGRGEHLVGDDLVACLRSGQLRGAIVDVFEREPLPPEHAFWSTPEIVVTPHMATMPLNDVIVRQVLENIDLLRAGRPLLRRVDIRRGY